MPIRRQDQRPDLAEETLRKGDRAGGDGRPRGRRQSARCSKRQTMLSRMHGDPTVDLVTAPGVVARVPRGGLRTAVLASLPRADYHPAVGEVPGILTYAMATRCAPPSSRRSPNSPLRLSRIGDCAARGGARLLAVRLPNIGDGRWLSVPDRPRSEMPSAISPQARSNRRDVATYASLVRTSAP